MRPVCVTLLCLTLYTLMFTLANITVLHNSSTCLMSIIMVSKQPGVELYTRDNKQATVVNQITPGSAMLQGGRVSPLRLTRWPVRNQSFPVSERCRYRTFQVFTTVCRHRRVPTSRVCRHHPAPTSSTARNTNLKVNYISKFMFIRLPKSKNNV